MQGSEDDTTVGNPHDQTDDLLERAVKAPDPDELPEKWADGDPFLIKEGAIHREWINEERKVMVAYRLQELTITLSAVEWSEECEAWIPIAKPITWFDAPNDEEAIECSIWLMERVNNGVYDEEIDLIHNS